MAFNGSGIFTRIHDWTTDLLNTVPVTASRMDAEMDGMATGLSTCLLKDGQQTATARIPLAQGVGLSDGSVSAPALNFISDTNTGLYRIGADNIGVAANGTKVADISATGIAVTGTLSASGAFTASAAANVVGDFSVATNKLTVASASGDTAVAGTLAVTGIASFTTALRGGDGTKSAPEYSFTADTDTGIYRIGADNMGISCGDTKIVDIASTGVSVTGGVTASNGLTISGGSVALPADSVAAAALAAPAAYVVIQTQAASNSANLSFSTGLDDTLYDRFILKIDTFKPQTDNVSLWVRIGTGAGPTYQTSGYMWSSQLVLGGTAVGNGNASDSAINMTRGSGSNDVGNDTGENICATMEFCNPESSNIMPVHGMGGYITAAGGNATFQFSGAYATPGAVTGIRVMFSSGNIVSGRATLIGVTKTA